MLVIIILQLELHILNSINIKWPNSTHFLTNNHKKHWKKYCVVALNVKLQVKVQFKTLLILELL